MKKLLLALLIILILTGGIAGYIGYRWVVKDNLKDTESGRIELFVDRDWNYDSLATALYPHLIDFQSFDRIADQMNLRANVIPGKYIIPDSLGNRDLIIHLRSGQTEDVEVVVNHGLKRYSILARIAEDLAIDSIDLANLINRQTLLDSMGYSSENWPCLFLANTYRFNWATSAKDVIKRFQKENEKLWTPDRIAKAENLGLKPNEVIILASIVDSETIMEEEMPRIAGVYLNRLQQNWKLGADPTIRYVIAQIDSTRSEEVRRRVLYSDLEIDHPYNTYKNFGLPPGPIILPSVKAIDAVLNAESHAYMYMCARDDFSGYHEFSKSARQHEIYRRAYINAINARGIMR